MEDHIPRDPRQALIVVDMQNLFLDLIGDAGPRVLAAVNHCVAEAVARGRPVFYTRDRAPIEMPVGDPEHLTDLHPGLDVRGTVVAKGPGRQQAFFGLVLNSATTYGATPGTGGLSRLAGLLRDAEVDTVIVVGLAGDVCVAATVRDARRLGYHVTVALHATAFVHAHPLGDNAAITDLHDAGITVTD